MICFFFHSYYYFMFLCIKEVIKSSIVVSERQVFWCCITRIWVILWFISFYERKSNFVWIEYKLYIKGSDSELSHICCRFLMADIWNDALIWKSCAHLKISLKLKCHVLKSMNVNFTSNASGFRFAEKLD